MMKNFQSFDGHRVFFSFFFFFQPPTDGPLFCSPSKLFTHRHPPHHPHPVRHALSQLESELGCDAAPVLAAANLVKAINYNNKASLSGAMIVAGFDAKLGGQVYGVPIGGALVRQEWATDGSGSTYIWGYLDDAWRPGMGREEAERLVVTSLALAMSIDGSSGGMARLVTVTERGSERRIVRGDEVPQFWDALEAPGKEIGGGESFVVV